MGGILAVVPTPSRILTGLGVIGGTTAPSSSVSVETLNPDPMLERRPPPPPPGDLRTKSLRIVVFAATIGLLMMLPKDEVERGWSLRACSASSACFRWRRLKKTKAMKATAATSRTAPTLAPAMTDVGGPPGPASGVKVGFVSAPELAPLFCPGVDVLVGEEEVELGAILVLWAAPAVVLPEPVELLLELPVVVADGLAGVVVMGAGF
jgi:hypothetical protein